MKASWNSRAGTVPRTWPGSWSTATPRSTRPSHAGVGGHRWRGDPGTTSLPAGSSASRDFRELFGNFYFGCEADDRMKVWASTTGEPARYAHQRAVQFGHRALRRRGHVRGAEESLRTGGRRTDDARRLQGVTFDNPVHFWTSGNRDFFRGPRSSRRGAVLGEAEMAGRLTKAEVSPAGPAGRPRVPRSSGGSGGVSGSGRASPRRPTVAGGPPDGEPLLVQQGPYLPHHHDVLALVVAPVAAGPAGAARTRPPSTEYVRLDVAQFRDLADGEVALPRNRGQFLTRSSACASTRASASARAEVTTRRAVIGMSSPVFGLRPGRSRLSRRSKLPNPDSLTGSLRASAMRTSSKKSSTISFASRLLRPSSSNRPSAMRALVRVSGLVGRSGATLSSRSLTGQLSADRCRSPQSTQPSAEIGFRRCSAIST